MRERGYYWVKAYPEWEVMQWMGDYFVTMASEFVFWEENEVKEINETRILNPDEK